MRFDPFLSLQWEVILRFRLSTCKQLEVVADLCQFLQFLPLSAGLPHK
jgi:hypothetical protein